VLATFPDETPFTSALTPRSRKAAPVRRRLFLLGLVGAIAVVLIATGAYEQLEPERLRALLRESGAMGPVLFVLAFTFLQPLGPSGHLFVVAAALLWSGPWAFVLSLLGASSAQLFATLFYRYVAYDWAQRHIPQRLAPYREQLLRRPFRTVLVIRLLTFTWPVVPGLLGVSGVRIAPMLTATLLGLAPMIAVDVWLGARVLTRLLDGVW